MKKAFRSGLLASTLLIGGAALATPAFAQVAGNAPGLGEPAAQACDEQTGGVSGDDANCAPSNTSDVVVTGSRIPRPDLEAVSPITTVGAEQLELTGTVTLETIINDLPQVIPGNNRTSNNSGGEAFATLDLRGLGPNRTLILVDGERVTPSSTTGTVDVSQIPVGLISRVEVVTGGATAVYGSDAIAGVINFVLKDNFEGLELTGQTSIAEEGIGFNFNVQGLFGANFGDGRGNITVSASYFDRDGVNQSRLPYSRTSSAIGIDANNRLIAVDDPADVGFVGANVIYPGGSGTSPLGQVVNDATNQFRNLSTVVGGNFASFNSDCNPNTPNAVVNGGSIGFNTDGSLRPFNTAGLCQIPVGDSAQYNFAPANLLLIPFDRINFASTARYEFTPETTAKLYATYARTESTANLAPTPASGGTGFVVGVDSPVIPANLAAALASRSFFVQGGTGTRFGTLAGCTAPTEEDGPANVCTEQSGAALPFSYNRRFTETGPRIANTESEAFQIRGTIEHQLTDAFSLSVVGSYGRSELDQYGIGNINRTAVEQGINGCRNAAGVVNGPGVLPGCVPVNIFGQNSIDAAGVRFIQTNTFDQSTFEQVRVSANLAGSLFELVENNPVGIAVGAEYRKDTGSSIPDDAKIRGEIIGFNQANPLAGSINVKEFYGELRVPLLGGDSFPNLLSIEGGARYSDYSSVGDLFNYKVGAEFAPFDFLRFRGAYNKAARAPAVFELFQNGDQGFPAVTDPCNEINAARNDALCVQYGVPAGLLSGFSQANSQVQAFAFGNPGLSEENAETYTAGVVISPSTFPLGRFSATVDYYDITVNDLNAAQGAQFFLNDCYANGNADACARIVRNPGTGQIDQVNTTRVNSADGLKTRGIDAAVNWVIPLDSIFTGVGGRIRIAELYTYVDSYTIGDTEFVDQAFAGIGGIVSRHASTLTVGYEDERFTLQGRWVYKSGGSQSEGLFGPDEDTGFTTPRIPDLNTVDLNVRWNVADRYSLSLIVENLLNDFPPRTASGTLDQGNSNVSFYDPNLIGRTYTVQARVKF